MPVGGIHGVVERNYIYMPRYSLGLPHTAEVLHAQRRMQ